MCRWSSGCPAKFLEDNEGFESLVRVADRMIIDSRRFVDLKDGLMSVPDRCPSGPFGCSVHDLAWTSLMPWRELTAQHFDPLAAREYLRKLARVTVRYAAGERDDAPSCAAVLYTAWLADRTQVRIGRVSRLDSGDYYVEASQEKQPVEIRLVSEDQGYAPGRLNSTTIQCGDENGTASFVTKGISGTELYIADECKGICLPPQVLDISPQSPAALAAQALGSLRRDRLYEEALETGLDILEKAEIRGDVVKPLNATIVVAENAEAAAVELAERFTCAALCSVATRGVFFAAISGGQSPRRTFELLAGPPFADLVPWGRTHVFFLR